MFSDIWGIFSGMLGIRSDIWDMFSDICRIVSDICRICVAYFSDIFGCVGYMFGDFWIYLRIFGVCFRICFLHIFGYLCLWKWLS